MSTFVAVDTGGTFTDLVMFDSDSRKVRYTKSLTTPENPIEGILACVDKAEVALDRAGLFKHGTTLVINTLVERSGPRVALVTTRGFRDVLDPGRGNRTEPFNLFFRRDPPLVPRELRYEIDERIDGDGNVLTAPERAQVTALAGELRENGVAAVAVSFLNSYLQPAHERLVSEWLREDLPGCVITAGSHLTREWYEYERTATAAANAYTGPGIGRYVANLGKALSDRAFTGELLMMGSNGGVLSPNYAASAPVLLVESGPVGGCIGAGAYGERLGLPNLIAFDMGGTTAKCALVRDGDFAVESLYHVGGYGRGMPIRAPVIDISEVGAGGGSIAWLDGQKRLHVGPRSAGSTPGPVAYGRGGTEPTVTDANLVLGRLSAGRFQGGEMKLDVAAAERAIATKLAEPLGYSGKKGMLEIACGILSIAAVIMGEAIKRITVERGQDPRDFVLFAYGGGGPLHAVELARELAIPVVVIPPEAGNFSAIGMLLADIRRDESRTYPRRLQVEAMAGIDVLFDDMESEMRASLAKDFGDVPVSFDRLAEMRYVGQYHTVRIPLRTKNADALLETFNTAYKARYGHAMEKSTVEFVSLHSVAKARTPQPEIAGLAAVQDSSAAPGSRPVFFPQAGGELPTRVYWRNALPLGFSGEGPAVIEEYGSTTVIGPGDNFEVGKLGELRIDVKPAGGQA